MRTTRVIHWLHKWTGLISGINVLILSVTGSYLVFDVDINRAFAAPKGAVVLTIDPHGATPYQTAIDGIVALHPNVKPTMLYRSKHEDNSYDFGFAGGEGAGAYRLNMVTGEVYPVTAGKAAGFNRFIFMLHDNLFLGKTGSIFLGVVGILFLVSTVTGIFIYGPFMKPALSGVLRWDRGARHYTAELHKMLGCLSLAFNVIIGVTGTVLTLAIIGTRAWFGTALLHAAEGGAALPAGAPLQAVDTVIQRGAAMQPGRTFFTVTYPSSLQGPNFYFCGYNKNDSITRGIPAPILVPVTPGGDVRIVPVPLWVKATYLCIPLHFGDFAGWGMKIVYCFFGLSSGVLSISGAILSVMGWTKRWRVGRRMRRRARKGRPLGLSAKTEGQEA
ncbi:MAG: hypothetical protein AMXMBFR84_49640 [Candidatus Hydrogenedentota bacterium]